MSAKSAKSAAERVRRVYPLPEAVEPGEWQVHDNDVGTTNILARHMDVPLGDDPASAWVRLHEMAHVTWSPAQAPPASDYHLLAAEDARVNLLLARSRLDTETAWEDAGADVKRVARTDPGLAALLAVAAAGTSDAAVALRALPPDVKDTAKVAVAMIRRRVRSHESAQRAAAWLREHLPPLRGTRKPGCGHGNAVCKDGGAGAARTDESGGAQWWEPGDALASLHGAEWKGKTPALFARRSVEGGRWGPMEVRTPALPARLPRTVGRGKWRPSDSGALPRRMERWATDKGVFSTRGRARGGTVLIDASGSMNISAATILRCVLAAPAATVAMYSCCCAEDGHGRGALVVLAARGRRVATVKKSCGGNIVDGPALRWLGSQRMPRVWVSDGNVTGVGDHSGTPLIREAADICKHFSIRRVAKIDDAVNLLGRGGRG